MRAEVGHDALEQTARRALTPYYVVCRGRTQAKIPTEGDRRTRARSTSTAREVPGRRGEMRFASADDQARWRSTLGQEPGEVEVVGAGLAGGLEVGAVPVAGRVGQLGVEPAGLAAVAVVLVVGQEPGQVAELGRRCRRPASSGRRSRRRGSGRRRGRRRGAASISACFSGSKRRAASAFSRIWSVFRIETQHEAIRSSVQIACSRPW